MPDVPNVLFVCTDQQTAGTLSAAGHDHVDTPAMDSLAERGVRFTEAYCPEPVCTPARGSLLTGRMPHETGVTANGDDIPTEYRTASLGHLFRDAGYETAYGGKWHLPTYTGMTEAEAESHGFDHLLTDVGDPSLADACVEFLEGDRDEPFLLTAMFDNPHNICEWAWGDRQPLPWGDVEDVPTESCPSLPRNFEPAPFEPKAVRNWREEHPGDDMSDRPAEDWRHYRHAYFRLVETVDREIGRVLDALDRTGLAEDTLVVFTSDHGDMQGAHRLAQKWVLYEESVHVPLVVAGPGVRGGAEDDHLVQTGLDLLPTLCDYAGADPPADLRGRSLRPLLARGAADDWRDYLVAQCHRLRARMVRTPEYKYVVYGRGPYMEQLFDATGDRDEVVNLAVDDDYADELERHRERLLEWCAETDDLYGEFYSRPGIPTIPGWSYDETERRFEALREE